MRFNSVFIEFNMICRPFSMNSFSSCRDYKAKQDLHIGLTDSLGNLVEFNENGLQFGTTEWLGCFQLTSIDALISDCDDRSGSKHPGQGPVNDVSDCLNRSNDDHLIRNFTSLTLAEKGSTADPHANSVNSQTKDRLTGFEATGSSFAISSKETINEATIETTTKTINKATAETTNKTINKTIDKMTWTPPEQTEKPAESSAYQAHLLADYWDYTLAICQRDQLVQRTFNAKTYSESENNCLSFVCFFFKLLDLEQFKELTNKTAFCERLVKPRLSELFKIIEFGRSDSSGYLPVRADFCSRDHVKDETIR